MAGTKSMDDKYLHLKTVIQDCLNGLDLQIFVDMDKCKKKYCNTIFCLLFEIQKGLELSCKGIDIQAYSQVGALLRQLLEQIATIKALIDHQNCIEEYRKFWRIRFRMLQANSADDAELESLYKEKCISKKLQHGKQTFAEYGWILSSEGDYGIETLMKMAGMADLVAWRSFFNNYVHNKISFTQYDCNGLITMTNELIYHIAIIFDLFLCCYYNYANFNFVINNIDFRKEFSYAYNEASKFRKNKQNIKE